MLLKLLISVSLLGLIVTILSSISFSLYARGRTFTSGDVPVKPAAIVFGAGLWRDGTPTPILRDRVKRAADLFLTGKVEKLLMSGDNSVVAYNEPQAMRDYATSLGVPEDAIVLDYAGRRTYDTCYRAKAIFGLTEAILVTQSFHLPRALYICSQLGLNVAGVNADIQVYRKSSLVHWKLRELIATVAALWDVHIGHPVPILGDPEPIFPKK
jgi:SanA protein